MSESPVAVRLVGGWAEISGLPSVVDEDAMSSRPAGGSRRTDGALPLSHMQTGCRGSQVLCAVSLGIAECIAILD